MSKKNLARYGLRPAWDQADGPESAVSSRKKKSDVPPSAPEDCEQCPLRDCRWESRHGGCPYVASEEDRYYEVSEKRKAKSEALKQLRARRKNGELEYGQVTDGGEVQ